MAWEPGERQQCVADPGGRCQPLPEVPSGTATTGSPRAFPAIAICSVRRSAATAPSPDRPCLGGKVGGENGRRVRLQETMRGWSQRRVLVCSTAPVKARATYTAPRRPRSWIGCQHLRLGSLSRDAATRRSSVRLVRELDLRAAGLVRIRDRKHRVMRAAATLAGQGSNPCVKRDSVGEEE